MTAEFDAISLQTAQLLLLYQSVKVEKTRHGSPQETPNKTPRRTWYFVTKIVLTYCEKKLF